MSMTIPTQVRIDSDVKKQATDLFQTLGLDMSSAINLFLHQCILRGGIPFTVEIPQYKKATLKAMEEAKKAQEANNASNEAQPTEEKPVEEQVDNKEDETKE